MTHTPPSHHDMSRLKAYDQVISMTTHEIKSRPASLLLNIQDIQMDHLKKNSEREVWTLFDNAIRHLKNGGPKGQAGLFSTAAAKVSLRSSYIAQTLMIHAPKFEQNVFAIDYTTPQEEVTFFCQRLCEFARHDFDVSQEKIIEKLNGGQKDRHHPFPEDIRKQTIVSFHLLSEAYQEATEHIYTAVPKMMASHTPKPPSALPKGGSCKL